MSSMDVRLKVLFTHKLSLTHWALQKENDEPKQVTNESMPRELTEWIPVAPELSMS